MHARSLFAPDNVARAGRAKLNGLLALGLEDDIAHLKTRFIRRAIRCDRFDAKPARVLVNNNRNADADVGVVHGLLVGLVFRGAQIVAPTVARCCDHCAGRRVGERFLVVVVDKEPVQIRGNFARLIRDGHGLKLLVNLRGGHAGRRHPRNPQNRRKREHAQHTKQNLLRFFHKPSRFEEYIPVKICPTARAWAVGAEKARFSLRHGHVVHRVHVRAVVVDREV